MDLGRADRQERLERLAAEYALGTLSPRARRRIAAVALRDPAVAAALQAWELRLAGLAAAVPEVAPPPRVWNGVVRRLGLASGEPGAATGSAPWSPLAFWRGLAVASTLAAITLGAVLVAGRLAPAEPMLVVVLAPPVGAPALVATAPPGARELVLKPVRPLDVPPGRALELWALPDGAAPRSLGLVDAAGTVRLALREGALERIPALAVSLEPPGGSPTGTPTGPVLFSGRVERLL